MGTLIHPVYFGGLPVPGTCRSNPHLTSAVHSYNLLPSPLDFLIVLGVAVLEDTHSTCCLEGGVLVYAFVCY
jgi:hypothetical protein